MTMPDAITRVCTVCDEPFEATRTGGRRATKCSATCRRRAASRHQQAYMRRLIEAREQLRAIQAA